MSDLPPELRTEILRLLREGLEPTEIARRTGATRGRIAAIAAHLSRGTYQAVGSPEILDELETTEETKFGLERDLQNALRRHISDLEPGLSIIDGGKERRVRSGLIDIKAQARGGVTVAIELKAGTADRDAVGQILSYMGDLMESEEPVRGILVAGEFTPRAVAAARAASNIRLVRYAVRFSFETVFPSSDRDRSGSRGSQESARTRGPGRPRKALIAHRRELIAESVTKGNGSRRKKVSTAELLARETGFPSRESVRTGVEECLLSGQQSSRQIEETLAKRFQISDRDRRVKLASGCPVWRNHVAWALADLVTERAITRTRTIRADDGGTAGIYRRRDSF